MTGLWVSPLYPHMGVSPDGVITCNCCDLEIKCPYSAKDATSVNSKTCNYLTDTGYLNRKHQYYTQIQGQLLVTGQSFCDFYLDYIKLQTRTNISLRTLLGEIGKKTDVVFCDLCASRDFDLQYKASCRK